MPALLKTVKTIENGVYKITFSLDVARLPESDKELLRKFGEPKINIGGNYLTGTPNAFTLPDKYLRVKSDLPYTQEFDAKSESLYNTDQAGAQLAAQTKATAFQNVFTQSYSAALVTLRANNDNFTSEYLTNI